MESQGELSVPMGLVASSVPTDSDCDLSVAVFHHPYPWLSADTAVAFRNHIERTADLVLTGHQHYDHGFLKQTLRGERLFYSEGDVLQDVSMPNSTGFRVILLDLDNHLRRIVSYSWKASRFSIAGDTDWLPLLRSPGHFSTPSPSPEFLAYLSDSELD